MAESRRIAWALFILFCMTTALWSESGAVKIENLRPRTELSGGWKFIYADSPDFSSVDYDDSAWKDVKVPNATFSFDRKASGYCWLRKTVLVSESLRGQTLYLSPGKLGDACQVYWNGTLIGESGQMPPAKEFSSLNAPRMYAIPSAIVRVDGPNVLSYRFYQMRDRTAIARTYICSFRDALDRYLFDFWLNSIAVAIIASALSVFLSLYYLLLYFKNRGVYLNLFAALAYVLFGVYFSSIYVEFMPVSYLGMLKFQFTAFYLGMGLFAFYFQQLFSINKQKWVRGLIAGVVMAEIIMIQSAPNVATFEFWNGNIGYMCVLFPILIYLFVLCVIAIRRKIPYATILGVGALLVIASGFRDVYFMLIGIQPTFWTVPIGMNAFILSIFLATASRSDDLEKEFRKKSVELEKRGNQMLKMVNEIKEIGKQVADTGESLDESIEEAGRAAVSMVESNRRISDSVRSQLSIVEKNGESMRTIVDAFTVVVDQVNRQAQFVDKSSKIIDEVVKSISTVYEITEKAKGLSDNLSGEAESSKTKVRDASVAIHDIESSSGNVKDIVEEIRDISDKTNILAMNAAIQSAHAGEYGRGFAVVASEVRKLSESSNDSTVEINHQIDGMIDKINHGVELFDHVREGLEKILEGTHETTRLIEDIALSSKDQYSRTSAVNATIRELIDETRSLKDITRRQMEESSKIRDLLKDFQTAAASIDRSTLEQGQGAVEIQKMIESVRQISLDNRNVVEKLKGLIQE